MSVIDASFGWLVFGATLALWGVAAVTVLSSAKFRRKGWWLLLSIVSFGWKVSAGDTVIFVGLPLGAIYILFFAWLGSKPDNVEK